MTIIEAWTDTFRSLGVPLSLHTIVPPHTFANALTDPFFNFVGLSGKSVHGIVPAVHWTFSPVLCEVGVPLLSLG